MTKLNKAQLEFLQILDRDVSDQDLIDLKRMVSRFFAQKAIAGIDQVWEEKGLNEDALLNEHMRSTAKQP
jgi:hypothetical protein